MYTSDTLIVNFLAGPGAGKSTLAAETFARLKWENISCELVTEFAKDIVWGETTKLLDNQIYVFAEQYQRIHRLLGKVDVIVTDAALINSLMYYDGAFSNTLFPLIIDIVNSMKNLNFVVLRNKSYEKKGRFQSEEEAKFLDRKIERILTENNCEFSNIVGLPESIDKVVLPTIFTRINRFDLIK